MAHLCFFLVPPKNPGKLHAMKVDTFGSDEFRDFQLVIFRFNMLIFKGVNEDSENIR